MGQHCFSKNRKKTENSDNSFAEENNNKSNKTDKENKKQQETNITNSAKVNEEKGIKDKNESKKDEINNSSLKKEDVKSDEKTNSIKTLALNKKEILKSDFELFFNQETKLLDIDGIEKIGTELNIDIDTNMILPYFLYRCGVKKLENISLNEYNNGLEYFKVSSIRNIDKNSWKMKFTQKEFKNFYTYLYELNAIKKIVPFEVIEVYFPQLFENIFFVKDFVNFLKKKENNNGLNKDQWDCFLELVKQFENNFPENFLVEDSWPNLFDDFYYEYCNNHGIQVKKQNEDDFF